MGRSCCDIWAGAPLWEWGLPCCVTLSSPVHNLISWPHHISWCVCNLLWFWIHLHWRFCVEEFSIKIGANLGYNLISRRGRGKLKRGRWLPSRGERSNCLTSSLISGENTFATTVAREEKICFDLQKNWKTRRGLFQTWDTRSPEWNFELGMDKDILAAPHSQTKHYTLKLFNTGHSSGWIYTRPVMQKRFQRLINMHTAPYHPLIGIPLNCNVKLWREMLRGVRM